MAIRIWSSAAIVAALLLPAGAGAQSPDPAAAPTLDARIAIPDGRRLHLVCTGPELTPHPIVLFEADLGKQADTWAPVQDALPDDVRACAWDRPGTGSSERSPGPRAPDDEVADLHALLTAAAVPPPYVIVGDSVGTWFAGAFATAHPDEVAGMVLADPVSPTRDAALRAILGEPVSGEEPSVTLARDALDAFLSSPETIPGQVDLRALSDRVVGLALGDRPLVILESEEPTGVLDSRESPVRLQRGTGGASPWSVARDRIRDWGLTRSSVVTHRWVPGDAGIAARAPDAVADAITDVHAKVGIVRGPGLAIARLQQRYDEPRDRTFLLKVEDRSALMTRVRSAVDSELPRLRLDDEEALVVRVLGTDRRRLAVAWLGHDARCEPEARLSLTARPLRVTIDLSRTRACAGSTQLRTVVLQLRAPLPNLEPQVALHRGLVSWIGAGPRRVTVDIPGSDDPATVDQVEVEDLSGEIVSARAAPDPSSKVVWVGDPDGVQTGEKGDELYVRWNTSPCVSWSRVTLQADRTISVQDGAAPGCDASSAPRTVALRFGRLVGSPVPGTRLATDPGSTPVPDGALSRAQAEAAAMGLSLVSHEPAGARLAQAGALDARLGPPDRWIWAIALRNPAGNDVCPDGIIWDGLPCPNLSATTTYLDAATGEVLLIVPDGL